MRTPAQQNASRTNGARSKGPVTAEGKARVSQNGTTHGIHSQRVVLQGEDPEAFRALRDSLVADWAPVSAFELHLIIDIAEARWRLARFTSLETAAIDYQVNCMRPDVDEAWPTIDPGTRHILAFNECITRNHSLQVLQTAIRHQHRIIDRATAQLLQLRKIRPDAAAPIGASEQGQPQEQKNEGVITVTPEQLEQCIEAAVRQRFAISPQSKPEPGARPGPPQPTPTQNCQSKPTVPAHRTLSQPDPVVAGASDPQAGSRIHLPDAA